MQKVGRRETLSLLDGAPRYVAFLIRIKCKARFVYAGRRLV
jgi:hypothetical protein